MNPYEPPIANTIEVAGRVRAIALLVAFGSALFVPMLVLVALARLLIPEVPLSFQDPYPSPVLLVAGLVALALVYYLRIAGVLGAIAIGSACGIASMVLASVAYLLFLVS